MNFQQHGRLTPTPCASLHEVDQFQETSEFHRCARGQSELVSNDALYVIIFLSVFRLIFPKQRKQSRLELRALSGKGNAPLSRVSRHPVQWCALTLAINRANG